MRCWWLFALLSTCAVGGFADSKTYSWTDCPLSGTMSREQAALFFDEVGATLRRDTADAFVKQVLAPKPGDDGYYVIHVVRWKDGEPNKPQTIDKQNWHVFHNGEWSDQDFSERKRIYGAKNVHLVYVHLNRRKDFFYSVTYNLVVTKKTPAFLAHLAVIGEQFGVGLRGGGDENIGAYYGTHLFEFDYIPSDLKFTPVYDLLESTCLVEPDRAAGPIGLPTAPVPDPAKFAPQPGFAPPPGPPPAKPKERSGQPATPNQPAVNNAGFGAPGTQDVRFIKKGAQVSGLNAETFDNEGRYFFDFSVGVPITKIRDVQFASATRDTLTATKVDKQSLYAFFNLYPVPVDVKRNTLIRWPHLVTGTKIGSQPLKKVVLAGGWGPVMANFYVGVLFNTQALPQGTACGSTPGPVAAGTKLSNKTCPEFTFGINLPVGALASAMKK